MDNNFVLSFIYKGQQFNLESTFVRIGYVHQFHVHLDERSFIFEFDEEQNYRMIDPAGFNSKQVEAGLIDAIAGKISLLHK
jgi:hypothetical protein